MAAYVASQVSTHLVPGLPREGAARRWELSADDRGDAAAVSPGRRSDLPVRVRAAGVLTGIRWWPLPVADGFAAIRCR
jgi:hypothetical protein